MLYRAGYSLKDEGQERILALTMKKEHFLALLERGVLSHGRGAQGRSDPEARLCEGNKNAGAASYENPTPIGAAEPDQEQFGNMHSSSDRSRVGDGTLRGSVRIQWDPERTYRLKRLPRQRSIQIGIPATLSEEWVSKWIVSIHDVTDKAKKLKAVLDKRGDVANEELRDMGLVPLETVVEVPAALRARLEMDSE